MSQLPQLRRELVAAAAREYPPAEPTPALALPSAPGPTLAGRGRRALRAAPALAAIAVVVAVAAVVFIVGGHGQHRHGTTTPAPTPHPKSWSERLQASRRALIDELAPLRRPQTAAERAVARTLNRHEMPFEEFYGTPDRALVRYATTTPWGARLYLVPITPWSPRQIRARLGARAHAVPPTEELAVYSPGGLVDPGAANAGRIRAGTVGVSWGTGHGRSSASRDLALVPDGVARVTYVLSREPGGSQYGYPVYPRIAHIMVTVHGNVAAYQTHRWSGRGEATIWYAADGHVIRRFGSIAAARRVVPVNAPAPETAKSRAAERDPSTPNRVSITPATGNASAAFTIHFRALLNGADYGYRWSGPGCSGYFFPRGFTETVVLRGGLVRTPLSPFPDRPGCRGTYRVSARVIGLEPIGVIRPVGRKITAKPFGSATFTVR